MSRYKAINLRQLEDDCGISIRSDRGMTLILLKANGEVHYGRTTSAKDTLVALFDDTSDMLMLAWTGIYKTDIFEITREQLNKHFH